MADPARQIVPDVDRADHAVALGFAQQGLRGDPVVDQRQRGIARDQRFEAVFGLAVFQPEPPVGQGQRAVRIAPVPASSDDIERDRANPRLGICKAPGNVVADAR